MFFIHSRTLLVCAALLPAFAGAADPGDPSADVPAVEYRSALDSFRRHAVEPVGSWLSANDTVGRQGAMHDHSTHDPGAQGAADPHARHGAPADPHAGHAGHEAPDGKAVVGEAPGLHEHPHPKSDASAQATDAPHACPHHAHPPGGKGMKHGAACPHCAMKEGGSDHAHH
jgi:hypothetical protein